jgi:Flp pilus assembly pilin Flp
LRPMEKWWPETESNHRHADFQSAALPTELSGHMTWPLGTPKGPVLDRSARQPVKRTCQARAALESHPMSDKHSMTAFEFAVLLVVLAGAVIAIAALFGAEIAGLFGGA